MNLPNLLTMIRFILIFPFAYFLLKANNYGLLISFVIYVVATITDYLDGYLARKMNLVTKIGAFLDPLADKLLVLTGFIIFSIKGYIILPLFLIFILAFREVFVTILRVEIKYSSQEKKSELKTSFAAKLKTTIQMLTLIICYIFAYFDVNNIEVLNILNYIPLVLFMICIYFAYDSGIKYVRDYKEVSRNTFVKFFSTTMYTGMLPKMPGTISSLFVYILLFFINANFWVILFLLFFTLVVGYFSSELSEKIFEKKDPGSVTIDEAAGVITTLLPFYIFSDKFVLLQHKLIYFILAFVLFRFFDIVKPLGIKKIQDIHGGLGIMIDDLLAAIYSCIVLIAITFLFF